MKFLVLPTTLFAFFAAGLLSGQENPASAEAEKSSAPNYVSINRSSSGENMLLVKYPWSTHAKASIEVRLVTEKKDYSARAKPTRFMANYFNAETAKHVFRLEDEALKRPANEKIEAGGMKWDIIGHSNHLGQAAVWIVNKLDPENDATGAAAVLCKPDPWSINDRTLLIDLPREFFDKPGKMYVWFLRGDQILWQNEVMWPGRR
jgi:hypothetical protein